jgi:hypothetical protein
MRPMISLIVGVALAALAIVPAALGEGRLAGSPQQDAVAYFYANERATLAPQTVAGGVSRPDSHEIASQAVAGDVSKPDSHEIAQNESTATATVLHGDDHKLADPRSVAASTPSSTSSDDELAWPQLGIGLGLGILLAAGLWLALRTRFGPIAH